MDGAISCVSSPNRRCRPGMAPHALGDHLHEVRCCVERSCVAGAFDSNGSRSGHCGRERPGQADHEVGAPRTVGAHDGNLDGREIGGGWIAIRSWRTSRFARPSERDGRTATGTHARSLPARDPDDVPRGRRRSPPRRSFRPPRWAGFAGSRGSLPRRIGVPSPTCWQYRSHPSDVSSPSSQSPRR